LDLESIIEIKVTYTNFESKYDEWIPAHSDRLLKQFTPDLSFNELKLNHRINILDIKRNKWRTAQVI